MRSPTLLLGDSAPSDRGEPFTWGGRLTLDRGPLDGTLVVDQRGVVRLCSASLAALLGRPAAEFVGRPARSLLPGLPLDPRTPGYNRAWAVLATAESHALPLQLVAGDGTAVAVNVVCATLPMPGEALIVVEVRGHGREPAGDELRSFVRAAGRSADSVMITDAAGVVEYVNPAFEAMTGFARIEMVGRTPALLKSGVHEQEFYRALWATILAGQTYRGVLVNRRKNGETYHEEMAIRPFLGRGGRITHFSAEGRDVSDRVREVERLRHAATHDGMTGLPNRQLFLDRLEQSLRHAARRSEGFALAIADVDRFKTVNDCFGHNAGDAVLQAVAGRLRQSVRDADTVARLGGDEFGLILLGIGERHAAAMVLEKVLAANSVPVQVEERAISVSISIGVCIHPADGRDADTIRERADSAMYAAKRAGGGACRFFRAPAPSDSGLLPAGSGAEAPGRPRIQGCA
jgi:diguanylate cyclase (GGDEF)-like protein/PAS domain S-box-containing protein